MKLTAIPFHKLILPTLYMAAFFTGCATTNTTNVAAPVIIQNAPEAKIAGEQTPLPSPQQDAVQPFATRVEWPEFPAEEGATSAFNMQSGNDENVWVEGKGYFRGTLNDVYRDLTDEKIIGPTHMTQDIVRDEFVETNDKTSYVMHIKMKYVLTIEFDLSVEMIPLYTQTEKSGLLFHSEKIAGTKFIKVISDSILIKQLENGWFSVEFLSINQATQDKEKEARDHLETLFGYWAEASKAR